MSLLVPNLNVVVQPTYEIGEVATKLLLKRIGDPTLPTQNVVLKATLLSQARGRAHHRELLPA